MGDTTVQLPTASLSRPLCGSNRGHPRGAHPLPVPLAGSKRAVQPATLGPAPRVDHGSRPLQSGRAASCAQAVSFLGGAGAHTSVDGLVRLAKAFPELPTDRLRAMQSQQSPSYLAPKKAKVTVHGPSQQKVLLTSNPSPREGMLSPDFLLSFISMVLLARWSTLVAEAVSQSPVTTWLLRRSSMPSGMELPHSFQQVPELWPSSLPPHHTSNLLTCHTCPRRARLSPPRR